MDLNSWVGAQLACKQLGGKSQYPSGKPRIFKLCFYILLSIVSTVSAILSLSSPIASSSWSWLWVTTSSCSIFPSSACSLSVKLLDSARSSCVWLSLTLGVYLPPEQISGSGIKPPVSLFLNLFLEPVIMLSKRPSDLPLTSHWNQSRAHSSPFPLMGVVNICL